MIKHKPIPNRAFNYMNKKSPLGDLGATPMQPEILVQYFAKACYLTTEME